MDIDTDGDGWNDDSRYPTFIDAYLNALIMVSPDTLNKQSKGKWITVYLELPIGYSVDNIDINLVLLNEAISPDKWDQQGSILMMKFNRAEVQSLFGIGDNEITITGELTDGTLFKGKDIVKVIE